MKGRVCLITGASNGIGEATALGLAAMNARVVMVCRNETRGRAAINRIRQSTPLGQLDLLIADLSSQAQIRELAAKVRSDYPSLHVLINNAGIFRPRRELSVDGIELTFATNHLAPFLLTQELLGLVQASGEGRITTLSSKLHERGKIDFENLELSRGYSGLKAYSNSKLANVLFTYELAKRLEGTGVTANAVHPGGVATGISNGAGFFGLLWKILRPILRTPEQGAETSVYVASSQEVDAVSGKYFVDKKPVASSATSHDAALAKKLWDVSEAMVNAHRG